MSIDTNISLTNNEAQFYKEFKDLAINEEPMPQGDAVIRISPFDDYVLITIYSDDNNDNRPVDLSNVGTLFLVFISDSDEIRIPNFTNVKDVDLASGQVVFRISAEDSAKILALSNDTFYISSKMADPDGESDESVIYSGRFLSFDEDATETLTKRLEELRLEYAKILGAKQSEIDLLNSLINEQQNAINEQSTALKALRTSNENLLNEIDELSDELINESEEAQKAEDEAQKMKDKIDVQTGKENNDTTGKSDEYWETEADFLEDLVTSTPRRNPRNP